MPGCRDTISGSKAMKVLIRLATTILLCTVAVFADDNIPEPTQKPDAPYRLFRTRNIYTLLKLETRTGRIWQVQWGTEVGDRWEVLLNSYVLTKEPKLGRFTLCPTSNIFNFILLDQEDGREWDVQWGKKEERLLVPIVPIDPDPH